MVESSTGHERHLHVVFTIKFRSASVMNENGICKHSWTNLDGRKSKKRREIHQFAGLSLFRRRRSSTFLCTAMTSSSDRHGNGGNSQIPAMHAST